MRPFGERGYQKIKVEVFVHYSGTDPPQCSNPFGQHREPYIDIRALSIDHINGDGATDVKGIHLYYRLKRERYPDGYQVLCMNCQVIKRVVNKEFGIRRAWGKRY